MLIATHYLLLKNWDIFATRCCILLIFNHNYFRGGEITHKYICINKGSRLGAFIISRQSYMNSRG